jgi:hypothetical protein
MLSARCLAKVFTQAPYAAFAGTRRLRAESKRFLETFRSLLGTLKASDQLAEIVPAAFPYRKVLDLLRGGVESDELALPCRSFDHGAAQVNRAFDRFQSKGHGSGAEIYGEASLQGPILSTCLPDDVNSLGHVDRPIRCGQD